MCGIVGIIDKKKRQDFSGQLYNMLNTIAHRGPDERKVWNNPQKGVYLGFARLSMVDLERSSQPFVDKKGRYVVLFNGEIYNYKTLKNMLIERGYIFTTDGEVEVILKLYLMFGDSFIEQLDGMFAIIIVDVDCSKVLLARDRFGIKPLFYYENEDLFVFASELKAIRCWIKLEIDYRCLEMYFRFRFIPAPYSIYQNVFKVKAGECIVADDKNLIHTQYFKYNQIVAFDELAFDRHAILLEEAILSTYECSEVPIGIFLSGGIDSGIIASILRENFKSDNLAFNIEYRYGFDNFEERHVVRELSKEIGIKCSKIVLDNKILNYLENMVYFLDEPFYSTVSISTYCLAETASRYVKGVLTGDGSDELVYGYNYIRRALQCKNDIYEEYLNGIGWMKYIKTSDLMGTSFLSKEDVYQIFFSDCKMDNDVAETLRKVELFKRLPDYHMTRIDRLTMAHGLEARLPYLRNQYVNSMLKIPSGVFLCEQDPKGVTKTMMGNALAQVLHRTVKKPFGAPIKFWIENDLKSDLERVFYDKRMIDKLHLNGKRLQRMMFDYTGNYADVSNMWGVYLLLKWCENEVYGEKYYGR